MYYFLNRGRRSVEGLTAKKLLFFVRKTQELTLPQLSFFLSRYSSFFLFLLLLLLFLLLLLLHNIVREKIFCCRLYCIILDGACIVSLCTTISNFSTYEHEYVFLCLGLRLSFYVSISRS